MDRFPSYVAGVSVEQGVVDRVVAGYVAGFQPDSVERERPSICALNARLHTFNAMYTAIVAQRPSDGHILDLCGKSHVFVFMSFLWVTRRAFSWSDSASRNCVKTGSEHSRCV